jgi:hypothetical protein
MFGRAIFFLDRFQAFVYCIHIKSGSSGTAAGVTTSTYGEKSSHKNVNDPLGE